MSSHMSLETRDKNQNYRCSINVASIIFNVFYSIGNLKYSNSKHGCALSNRET